MHLQSTLHSSFILASYQSSVLTINVCVFPLPVCPYAEVNSDPVNYSNLSQNVLLLLLLLKNDIATGDTDNSDNSLLATRWAWT